MSPRILITGASGFIGGHTAAAALATLDDATPSSIRLMLRNPDAGAGTWGSGPGAGSRAVDVVRGDLADPGSLRGICDGVDVVLHCASYIGGDERSAVTVNDHGTRALVAEAARAGVGRVVYVSTAAVYGRGPFRAALPDRLPPAPASPTSRSRAAAERHVLDAGGVVLRPHLVLGPGDRWVVPGLVTLLELLSAGLKGVTARHSVVDVRALARAVVAAGLSDRDLAGAHHVNHPDPVDTSELLDTVADLFGLRLAGASLSVEEARARLGGRARGLHHLGMLAVDHWFAGDGFWSGVGVGPGVGFAGSLAEHAGWYRGFLGRR
ncbi:NAD-dependent epimerase/dehydratase family protein [Streptomyces viridochromogenes]|uniref:Putative NAD-dependent epimerase/dehydratase family protein n=1 Tax=Streptomyces viridochromogenes Tue57 TaxID=1160705 RepID=L8P6Z5_STRVR|nr:NAD-dependent epimerase/dehydratase family protein [Streptomyces viridochromogenes]ELS53376.1 putative NAD-dependent epimerase/dehydratase family protein [Streptomyces viridochromogenes Tue57]